MYRCKKAFSLFCFLAFGLFITPSFAVTFDMNFESYADTTAMKADFVQSAIGGGHYILHGAYDIALDSAVSGADGNTCRLTVTPSLDGTQSADRTGVWLFTGGSWPSGTFQNGTDFSLFYDIRVDAAATSSFKEKITSPGFIVPSDYNTNFNQNHSFISAQSDYNGSSPGSWGLAYVDVEGEDGAGAGVDEDAVGIPFSAIFTDGVWYRCRVLVDWATDGITTNDTVTATFKIWNRDTGSESTADVYTFPAAVTPRHVLGDRSGDAWGINAFIYDSSTSTFNIWYDNIQFVDSLTDVDDWQLY